MATTTSHAPAAHAYGSQGAGSRGRLRSLVTGRADDPRWARPSLIGLLVGTALLYLINLSSSGWANSFYSAAVQAGTVSWKAFLFGSSDAGNSITVDKPPAFLWPMEISARLFGLSSFTMLLPDALAGIGAVWLLYATVRRVAGPAAGLIAGGALALTPIAVLMFRFNNPEALMVFLFVLAAYATMRALEKGRLSWLALAGFAVGAAFLTKTLEALLVLPALAIVFLVAAPLPFWRRITHLLWAGLVMVVSGGWWVALVSLWPASDRPFIGGSQDNSEFNLIFGYNGFGRLTGNETGSVGGGGAARTAAGGAARTFGGGGGGAFGGGTGWSRLFGSQMGSQIAWLLPAALILMVGGFWLTRRTARTDLARAAFGLFGLWLGTGAALFSFSKGIIHPYYTVAIAPAIAALVGLGVVGAWRTRSRWDGRLLLAASGAAAAITAYELLGRTPTFLPWLRWVVLIVGIVGALLVLVPPVLRGRSLGPAAVAGVLALCVAGLAGPAAYAEQTASVGHTGSLPTAGPASAGGFGGFGGGAFRGRRGTGGFTGTRGGQGFPGGGTGTGGTGTGGTGGRTFPGGGTGGPGGTTGGQNPFGGTGTGGTRGGGGGTGSLLEASTPSAALQTLLKTDAKSYTWVAAAIGSESASGYQLATGDAVMPIGGFNGSDPSPTLAQFEKDVAAGKIHYFIAGGSFGQQNGGSTDSAQISSWVQAHFTAKTVGGTTVYDLTAPTSGS
jgi:4-amino-4-deoxy-L-arabinose transferase-like glycosyltransferase